MSTGVALEFGPLTAARFVERPNRFLVRCRLVPTGEVIEAHLADPGRLRELLLPETLLYLRLVNNPKRKTKWSVILAADGSTLVSLQSTLVNQLAAIALKRGALPELAPWQFARAEYTLGSSRWDFLLRGERGRQLLLEIKSCSLVQNGVAMFPDAVTARGRRHVLELAELRARQGYAAAVLFIVQRADATVFRPAGHIDPEFTAALRSAAQKGVQILARGSLVSQSGITLGEPLTVDLT